MHNGSQRRGVPLGSLPTKSHPAQYPALTNPKNPLAFRPPHGKIRAENSGEGIPCNHHRQLNQLNPPRSPLPAHNPLPRPHLPPQQLHHLTTSLHSPPPRKNPPRKKLKQELLANLSSTPSNTRNSINPKPLHPIRQAEVLASLANQFLANPPPILPSFILPHSSFASPPPRKS